MFAVCPAPLPLLGPLLEFYRPIGHVEVEPVGERDHSDWLFSGIFFNDFSPALDTGWGKPLEPVAVVGLSMIEPI